MKRSFPLLFLALILALPQSLFALSSNNIPLDSPAYGWLDKLYAYGVIKSDFAGIKPITRAEAARQVIEADKRLAVAAVPRIAQESLVELKRYLRRELSLYENPVAAAPVDLKPLSEAGVRFVFLDGVPRNYERGVHDPGGEGVFGIGAGLRPVNPYPSVAMQRGSEGTPLMGNNEGTSYPRGGSIDFRFNAEANLGEHVSMLLEPQLLIESGNDTVRINKGYLKAGGGKFEFEAGRDANWLGFGRRGALTLSNNAENFNLLKFSNPEPLDVGFLGKFKYTVIFSRFDSAETSNGRRQPWFYAIKGSLKPVDNLEIGINLGRQQGGPGVNNSLRDNLQGLVGGTGKDNSNSLGGVELRWRIPSLRNTELFGEFSGEDAAKFWPFVESYLAGIYIPRLTDDGSNDFRFEYFHGNSILYTHGQFSEGYVYKGLPIGHSQGGATRDFFFQYGHWFTARQKVTLDYIFTVRGFTGRLPGQALERKHAVRGNWLQPLSDKLEIKVMAGMETVSNFDLIQDSDRRNFIASAELNYRF